MLTLRRYRKARDFETLYEELGSFSNSELLYPQLSLGSEEAFTNWLEKNMATVWHDFFMVELDNGPTVGFVYSYEFRRLGGICKICCYIYERYRGIGVGPLAGLLFLDCLFNRYPLRKVYAEIFEYNKGSLDVVTNIGMEQEARFREAYWHENRYIDQFVFSLDRGAFDSNPSIRRLLRGLAG